MSESNLLQLLGQVSAADAGEVFRDHLRGCVRTMISDVMAAEVHELCGPKHLPAGGDTYRAGSSPGRVLVEGEREEVTRPRVRRRQTDGRSQEVPLATYRSACDPQQLQASIVTALTAGVSTRDLQTVQPKSPGVGKSNVSRLWQNAGQQFVDALRSHDLSEPNWLVLMLDGIWLSKDQLAVVAIGITTAGHKRVLDFELGSTENAEVCSDLMRRVLQRGFHCERPLLAVLDGSAALRTAVQTFFPDAVVQRCLVHKEKNIQAKLSRKHWGELARLFRRLRQVQGKTAAEEVVGDLERFLQSKNAAALQSLREAGDELIALHSLDVPSTLHRHLLSTNAIENSFRNTRRKLGRVTRFRAETDQATRWLAFALSEVEKGFRRLAGYKDLPHLAAALEQRRARELANRTGPFPSPPATTKAPIRQVATTNELPKSNDQ